MSMVENIDCGKALQHLFEYLDRELDGELQQRMQQHMHDCRSCFSRLEFEQTLKSHVREAGRDRTPDSLRRRINGLIREFDKES